MRDAVAPALRQNFALRALESLRQAALHGDPLRAAAFVMVAAAILASLGLGIQFLVVDPAARDPLSRPTKQLAFVCLGLLAVWFVVRIGYRRVAQAAPYALGLTWVLLLGLAIVDGGTKAARWIDIGPFQFQPSEVAKIALMLTLARFAVARGADLRSFSRGFLPAGALLATTAGLVAIAPDLGQTLFIVATSGALLLVAGIRAEHVVPTAVALAAGGFAFLSTRFGYIGGRVGQFLDEEGGFQVREGIFFLGRGGAFGTGIDDARAATSVPEVHNDFVMVALGEVLGFLGSACVVLAFAALVFGGLRVALAARDRLGHLVAFGATFLLGLQAIVNLAVVTGSVPPKGMALPFLSYGGSSMLATSGAIGLILSVAFDAKARSGNLAQPSLAEHA